MRTKVASLLLVVAGALLSFTCAKVPLTAAPGSDLFLQANPTFVVANGGRSVVTAFITEPVGTPVPDGTVVFFFTNLGSIDEQVKTRDGIARANFVADSRSGKATVNAFSGGSAVAPTGTGTGTGTGDGGTGGGTSTATGNGKSQVTIDVGSSLPKRAVLTANPPRIAGSRQTELVATVYDGSGNPVQNVPVIFTIIPKTGSGGTETLDSGGAPRYTDSNGQAFDVIRSRALAGGTGTTVTVQAILPVGEPSNEVQILVLIP